MKEVSTRPMAQRRILYVIAVKYAGVTVSCIQAQVLRNFGEVWDVSVAKKKRGYSSSVKVQRRTWRGVH